MAASTVCFGAAPVRVLPNARYWGWVCSALFWALFASAACADDEANLFGEKVRPMLENRCLRCHSQATGKMNGGLALIGAVGGKKGANRAQQSCPVSRTKVC